MSLRLENRQLVVIGGTAGIGLSASAAFVREGASVVVVGRNPVHAETARRQLGDRVRVFTGDATDPETAERAIDLSESAFGGFTGLYHVAGGSGRGFGDGPLHEISDDGWRSTLELNLTSLFYSNRAAVRRFLERGTGGSVLNCGSVLGFSPSSKFFNTHAYASSKEAIVGLTQSSAAYYAGQNIRFNVLAPALVATNMSERAQGNADIMRFVGSKQPLDGGRIGKPTDLDAAAVYFVSDESRFVTGQVLAVDGGWCVSEGQWSGGE